MHIFKIIKAIVIALVDRLSGFASRGNVKLQGKDGDLFSVFSEQLSKIIDGRESMALEHVLGMQVWSLIFFGTVKFEVFWKYEIKNQWELWKSKFNGK